MPPATIYQELEKADPTGYEELLEGLVTGWTVMVKDSEGSKDGWFWANLNAPGTTFLGNSQTDTETIDANVDDYSHILTSGFGLYTCRRCHASAEKEFTFPSTENIKGFPGAPLQYHIDNSWRSTAHMGGLLARIPEHRRGGCQEAVRACRGAVTLHRASLPVHRAARASVAVRRGRVRSAFEEAQSRLHRCLQ